MKFDPHIRSLLYRSFDEELSETEQIQLEQALARSEELKREKEDIRQLRGVMAEQDFQYKPFFATRLMARIDRLRQNEDVFPQLLAAFKRVAIPSMALATILFLVTVFMEQSITLDTLTGVSQIPEDDLLTSFFVDF